MGRVRPNARQRSLMADSPIRDRLMDDRAIGSCNVIISDRCIGVSDRDIGISDIGISDIAISGYLPISRHRDIAIRVLAWTDGSSRETRAGVAASMSVESAWGRRLLARRLSMARVRAIVSNHDKGFPREGV